MTNQRFFLSLFCSLILLAAFAASADAARRNITEKDLFGFVWIGDPQVSPDGSRVAFVRVTVNDKKEGYDTAIWTVGTAPGEEPRQLTNGPHDSIPRWSPDGNSLVFARATEKNGKPEPPQLCLLSMTGGDAFPFTTLPKGAANPVWSPDGKSIAFLSTTNAEDLAKQEKEKQKEEKSNDTNGAASAKAKKGESATVVPEKHESDIHVVTRAIYRSNDEGYLDPKHPRHIWVVAPPRSADETVEPKQLTSGRFDEDNIVWSKGSADIYFTSLHVDEPYYELPKSELYSVAAKGGSPKKLTTINMDIGGLKLSPDGKQIAFIAAADEPVNSYTQPLDDRSHAERAIKESHGLLRLGCRRRSFRRQRRAARSRRQRPNLVARWQKHHRDLFA